MAKRKSDKQYVTMSSPQTQAEKRLKPADGLPQAAPAAAVARGWEADAAARRARKERLEAQGAHFSD